MEDDSQETRRNHRRRQILSATLHLVRDHGTGISTSRIAAAASCSKETLYNWFGDRDGIFQALIDEQAMGMRMALERAIGSGQGDFDKQLATVSAALLDILTGDAVVTVNRIAMSQTCRETQALGQRVLDEWQSQIRTPVIALIEQGIRADAVEVKDTERAFESLMGLILGDRQLRLMLGGTARPPPRELEAAAYDAVTLWMKLHGKQSGSQ